MSVYEDDLKDYIKIVLFFIFLAIFLYFYMDPISLFIKKNYESILFFVMVSLGSYFSFLLINNLVKIVKSSNKDKAYDIKITILEQKISED